MRERCTQLGPIYRSIGSGIKDERRRPLSLKTLFSKGFERIVTLPLGYETRHNAPASKNLPREKTTLTGFLRATPTYTHAPSVPYAPCLSIFLALYNDSDFSLLLHVIVIQHSLDFPFRDSVRRLPWPLRLARRVSRYKSGIQNVKLTQRNGTGQEGWDTVKYILSPCDTEQSNF